MSTATAQSPGTTIVVVDDSLFARQTTIVYLRSAGFDAARFVEAENGEEALRLLKEQGASLVVTDLNMPVMDGRSLLRRVQANPRLNRVPVVVMSSAVGPALCRKLERDGAAAVLKKPLSGPQTAAVLASLSVRN